MEYRYEIPEQFFGLFRSPNRDTYIEALLIINEEYEYQSYFLSRESCIRILGDYFSQKKIHMLKEEDETELDLLETPANRILGWLLKNGWLKKLEDYYAQVTNIIIPDYAAVFIEAFEKLTSEEMDETDVYIQNIYAILFSLRRDDRASASLLKTALVNTRRLNKSLQDMLHNMDRFFASLLEKEYYGDLLRDHLEGYVEEIIRKKYHILKTSDNFYIYKNDIKRWIREMQEDYDWIEKMVRQDQGITQEEILTMLDRIDRGFDDIERRIANMDREHMKYIKATVVRLNYLLSGEGSMKELIIELLNHISAMENPQEGLERAASAMNLFEISTVSAKSLYRRRRPRKNFIEQLKPQEEQQELSKEDILRLNKIHKRYSRRQIEEFLEEHEDADGTVRVNEDTIETDADFERLILAYDYAGKKDSSYSVEILEDLQIESGGYSYPKMIFQKKKDEKGAV